LQVKFALKDDQPVYYIKSDQADPTIYFSFLPQFAEEIQKKEKGIVFVGENFVLGLLGKPTLLEVSKIEALCKEHSTKEVKARS